MTVPSFQFLALALAAAIAFNLSAAKWWRAAVLMAVNLYVFQSFAGQWTQLLPFIGFLAIAYAGILLRPTLPWWGSWLLPVVVLALFVWLKRYLFVPPTLLLTAPYVTVGLSYVFFRVMHLAIDGWETLPRNATGFVSYLNYTLNFTSLVSGPIQRYEDYRRCEAAPPPVDPFVVGRALERIIVGFFKVYLLSALVSELQHEAIAALPTTGEATMRIGLGAVVVGAYPVYLYLNFSGYTDFVVGIARLFRIELPENFDRPFSSLNFIDFWNRWHITLSTWLKTYVYSPLLLSLMRRFPARGIEPFLAVLVYFVTFFLVGFWHGQTSEFLCFGLLQGGGVAANKLYQTCLILGLGRARYAALARRPLYQTVARGLTFAWFAFTLLWFWSNWGQLHALVAGLGWPAAVAAWLLLLAMATIVLAAWEAIRSAVLSAGDRGLLSSRYLRTACASALTFVILVAALILNAPAPEIVYKSF
ncbi:MAG TPA: MBOAT family O-acyltransferase [Aliidongia sp.]|nr:MBOAT family O-acyltransferase [Aliidongia sp.]